jgi:DNA-binding MarR family transcriptional regulator
MTSPPLPTLHNGPSDSPGFLLWRISNSWQREQRAALQPLGLTHTQFVMLAVATWFSSQEHLTQARLSQLTGSDPMTTSQIVRTLLANGLFLRDAHPTDTRAKLISVSDAGRELAAKAIVVVEAVDRQFFAPLAEEQASLVQLFQRLLAKEDVLDEGGDAG